MNQQPDKLFRQKLEGHSKPVPADAWNKVEARLKKNSNKGLWLKIAASITLLACASFFLWKKNSVDTLQHISQNKIDTNQKPVQEKQNTLSVPKKVTPQKVTVPPAVIVPPSVSSKKQVSKQTHKKSVTTHHKATSTKEIAVDETQQEVATRPLEPVLNETEVATQTLVKEQSADEVTGVTLVFTAEEMAEKYLDKKSFAKATSSGKKPSTLRKLLDKAYDLKNNQDPFGELRQKKNEILALNFKNEKQRSQNK